MLEQRSVAETVNASSLTRHGPSNSEVPWLSFESSEDCFNFWSKVSSRTHDCKIMFVHLRFKNGLDETLTVPRISQYDRRWY